MKNYWKGFLLAGLMFSVGFFIGDQEVFAEMSQQEMQNALSGMSNQEFLQSYQQSIDSYNRNAIDGGIPETVQEEFLSEHKAFQAESQKRGIGQDLASQSATVQLNPVPAFGSGEEEIPKAIPVEETQGVVSSGAGTATSGGTTSNGLPPGYTGPVFDGAGLTGGAIQAQVGITGNISKEKSLLKLIAAWIRFLLPILAFAAVAAIIYAGYIYVTGGGDDGRYEKAKGIILWVVVGLLVALGSYAIVSTILNGVT